MDDIVEKLRSYPSTLPPRARYDMKEAADEIERLRAALKIYADPKNWNSVDGCEFTIQDEFTDPTPRKYTNVCGFQLAQETLNGSS